MSVFVPVRDSLFLGVKDTESELFLAICRMLADLRKLQIKDTGCSINEKSLIDKCS